MTKSNLWYSLTRAANRIEPRLRENAFPLGVGTVLRVWTLVWASLVAMFVMPSAEAARHYSGVVPLSDPLLAPWQRWDAIWYSKIALEGYSTADLRVAFFPFYPLLMRVVLVLFNNVIASGLIVATVAALVSFILFYQLALQRYDAGSAKRALLFLAFFPTGFYLFAPYTESLFLALSLGTFLCMQKGRWVPACLLGGLAAMTRPQGILIIVPIAIEFWEQYRRGQVTLKKSICLGLVVCGGAAHVIWLALRFGSWSTWLDAQANWRHFAPPWEIVLGILDRIANAPSAVDAIVRAIDPFFGALFLAAFAWSWFRLPHSYTALLAVILFPPLLTFTTSSDSYPLASLSRYVLLAFPAFLLVGSLPRGRWQAPLWTLSFLLQNIWLMLFVSWVFVG